MLALQRGGKVEKVLAARFGVDPVGDIIPGYPGRAGFGGANSSSDPFDPKT